MATRILIPTPLRGFTDKQDVVEADGQTVGELLANMTARYTGLRQHLYAADGSLRADSSTLTTSTQDVPTYEISTGKTVFLR